MSRVWRATPYTGVPWHRNSRVWEFPMGERPHGALIQIAEEGQKSPYPVWEFYMSWEAFMDLEPVILADVLAEKEREFDVALGEQSSDTTKVNRLIAEETNKIRDLLMEKNRLYGNAALEPLNIFSPLNAEDAIRVRLDDKLKRLRDATGDTEDTEFDLIGYLILMRVNRRLEGDDHDG